MKKHQEIPEEAKGIERKDKPRKRSMLVLVRRRFGIRKADGIEHSVR
jgi:hypothetical protein